MYTIAENKERIDEIKNSKFITKLYKIKSVDEINEILKQLKVEYQDATHICYAYKLGTIVKFSDDKEPSGTAGLPMMEVLNKNQLDFILAVVIRYFGGIKLGSGGLIRAYSSSVKNLVKTTEKKELVDGYTIQIICSYDKAKILDYKLKDIKNIEKKYDNQVTFKFQVDIEEYEKLKEWNPSILNRVQIEKDFK